MTRIVFAVSTLAATAAQFFVPMISGAALSIRQVSDFDFATASYYDRPEFGFFIEYNNELYFTATAASNADRNYLFKTDGQSLTQFDVDPGLVGSLNLNFFEFKDLLYFRANGEAGTELYRTDGSTLTLFDLNPGPMGSGPRNFFEFGGELYFGASHVTDDYVYTSYLYKTDGTTIRQVANDTIDSSYPWQWPSGDKLFFTANGDDGFELYYTNGNDIVTVGDLNPGPASSDPWPKAELNGEFYFTAITPQGRLLFRTDGESLFTLPLLDDGEMYGGPSNFTQLNGELFFVAKQNNGYELFKTDGITVAEFDINPGAAGSAPLISGWQEYQSELFFTAGGVNGRELYATDGNSVREIDINPGPNSSDPLWFREFNGELYFRAIGPNGKDLYKTDGSSVVGFDINPGPADSEVAIHSAVEFDGNLFFAADTLGGWELTRTDGVSVTTFDLNPGPSDSFPRDLTVLDDRLLFAALGSSGWAVYSTDGNTVELLADLNPHSEVETRHGYEYQIESISGFVEFNNQLLFIARASDGYRLFSISYVPEPATWSMLLVAISALVLSRPRRQ
jgi:ELWxxDGT repeat protein